MRETMRLAAILMAASLGAAGCGGEIDDNDNDLVSGDDSEIACSGGAVTFYQGSNYSGPSLTLCKGAYPDLRQYQGGLGAGKNWSDRISSFWIRRSTVAQHIRVKFYRDIDYHRELFDSDSSMPYLTPVVWNDQASSIRIYIDHTYCMRNADCPQEQVCLMNKCVPWPFSNNPLE